MQVIYLENQQTFETDAGCISDDKRYLETDRRSDRQDKEEAKDRKRVKELKGS